MGRKPSNLLVSDEHRTVMEDWILAHGTPQQVVKRCQMVLGKAEGKSDSAAAKISGMNRHSCRLWRKRFERGGPDSLWEVEEGRGRKPTPGLANRIIEATLHTKPAAETQWSTRTMGKQIGADPSTVYRIWQEHEIKPHLQETFKLSKDPNFTAKLLDVVGIYLHPPQNAFVLCVDEKSQIQALDRTQPGLPIKRGRCGTWTHDYVRHGTTTLFAALNVATGKVCGHCYPRHRHQEFIKFLREIDGEYNNDIELHLVLDNYGTHKHPKVVAWLKRHSRFHVHFIPTSSSWLNQVERWFGKLSGAAIRRGSFSSVPDLIEAILHYITVNNTDPKPFVWKAKAEIILEKIERCRRRLEEIQPGCTARKTRKKAA
jgi:transposase